MIVTSNCFLIVIWELVKSTLEILSLGNCVYKLLSSEFWNLEESILKLDGLIVLIGRPPSHIPVTLLTPDIVKECCATLSTFAKETVLFPGFVYWTIFPTVAIPLKNLLGSVKVTVDIPK